MTTTNTPAAAVQNLQHQKCMDTEADNSPRQTIIQGRQQSKADNSGASYQCLLLEGIDSLVTQVGACGNKAAPGYAVVQHWR